MSKEVRKKHNMNYRIIQGTLSMPDSKAPENQKIVYDAFRSIVKAGTNDDSDFVKFMDDVGNSFVNRDLRIMALGYAAGSSHNGSAFQERMMNRWAENIDTVEDIYEKIKFTSTAADAAEDNSQFCYLATDKMIEAIKQLSNSKLVIHVINQTLNETVDDGYAKGSFNNDRHFTFALRYLKRQYKEGLADENIKHVAHYNERYTSEKLSRMKYVAESLGYKV